jgi:hypothetical protein
VRQARLLAAREETAVAVACVAGVGPLHGEDIAHLLGDLPPVLHVRSLPARRRLAVVLPREGADRLSMCRGSCRLSVSIDFTSESGISTYPRQGGCTNRSRE